VTSFVALGMRSEICSWFLLHGNGSKHWFVLVQDLLAKSNETTLEHPPYSPDLIPGDFYLLPWLKIRAGRSGIESQLGRDFPPVQTGSWVHPASCTMGTGSFPGRAADHSPPSSAAVMEQ